MTPDSLPPRVLGIAGQKGHGKNLLAAFIETFDASFQTDAFANRLKEATSAIFNIEPEVLHSPLLKEEPFAAPIVMNDYVFGMREVLHLPEITERFVPDVIGQSLMANSARELMQLFGTEYVRSVAPNYWAETTLRGIAASKRDTVIADVRFQNEVDAVHSAGGFVVQVVRDGRKDVSEHPSEALDFTPDAVFHIATGDYNRVRDCAMASVALVNGPRMFYRQESRYAHPANTCGAALSLRRRYPSEVTH